MASMDGLDASPEITKCIAQFVVLIPAYEPNDTLVRLVDEILTLGRANSTFAGVIIVNDGSVREGALRAIEELRSLPQIKIIAHEQNQGKGAALKTGFQNVLDDFADVGFVVSADADGQHTATDIFRVAADSLSSGNPCIGYRTFANDIPLRSRVGNISTAALFSVAGGAKVNDTQSGLRSYIREDLTKLLAIESDRYDFEFHCLFQMARNKKRPLGQIPIETIYEPGNPTSHFNPLLDSARIYFVFFRYVSISALSGSTEFVVFSILNLLGLPNLAALVVARMCSAPLYFLGMRNVVFRSADHFLFQALGTALLMVVHVALLWRFIGWLENGYNVHPSIAMLSGLLTFYVGNFLFQRYVIYPIRRSR